MAAMAKVVEDFKAELNTLTDCRVPVSRTKITAITKLAMKAVKYYKHVVMIVEKFVSKCSPLHKLPALYVVDSIVRQSKHQYTGHKEVFGPRFSKNLEKTFSQLFRCVESDVPKIIRVLNLWQKNKVYSPEVIQPLLNLAPRTVGSPQEQPSSTQPPGPPKDLTKPSSGGSPIAPQPMDSLLQKQQDQLITLLEVGAEASGKSELLEVILDKAKKLQALQTIQQKLIADKTDHQNKLLEAQSAGSSSSVTQPPQTSSTRQSVVANEFSKALLQDFDYSSDEDGEAPRPPAASNDRELPSELSIIDQLEEQFQREKMLQRSRPAMTPPPPQEQSPFGYESHPVPAPPTSQEEPKFLPLPSEPSEPPQPPHFAQDSSQHFQDVPHPMPVSQEQPPPPFMLPTQQEMPSAPLQHNMPRPQFPAVSQPLFTPPPSTVLSSDVSHTNFAPPSAPPTTNPPPSENMPPSFIPPAVPLLPPYPPQGHPPPGVPIAQGHRPPVAPPPRGPPNVSHFTSQPPPQHPPQNFGEPNNWQSFPPPPPPGPAPTSKFSSDPPPFHFHQNSPCFKDERSNSPHFERSSPLRFERNSPPRFERNSPHRFERSSPPPPPPPPRFHNDNSPRHFHDRSSPRLRDEPPAFKRGRGEWDRRERGGGWGDRGGDWDRERIRGGEWEEWDRDRDRGGRFHDRERSPLRFERGSRWSDRNERSERKSSDREKKWNVKHKHITVYSTTVWVGHISKSTTKPQIQEAFGEYGPVKSVDHVVARGCAYVVMEDRDSAEQAVKELSREGSKFCGQKCKVAWAPGRAIKSKQYREFWQVDTGISIIPWKSVKTVSDLEAVSDGGWADPGTIESSLAEKAEAKRKKDEEDSAREAAAAAAAAAAKKDENQGKWSDAPPLIPPPGLPPPIPPIISEPSGGGGWLEPPILPPMMPPPMVPEVSRGRWAEPPPIPPVFSDKLPITHWNQPINTLSTVQENLVSPTSAPRPLFDAFETDALQQQSQEIRNEEGRPDTIQETQHMEATAEAEHQEELNEDKEVKEMEIDEDDDEEAAATELVQEQQSPATLQDTRVPQVTDHEDEKQEVETINNVNQQEEGIQDTRQEVEQEIQQAEEIKQEFQEEEEITQEIEETIQRFKSEAAQHPQAEVEFKMDEPELAEQAQIKTEATVPVEETGEKDDDNDTKNASMDTCMSFSP